MKANEIQVGGNHYKTAYEHWDLVVAVGMGYFEGQATKYITRWRKKNGLEDLQKALHYINKLIEVLPKYRRPVLLGLSNMVIFEEVCKFSLINGLSDCEQAAIMELAYWQDEIQLIIARDCVLALMDEAEPKPVPATDSNKHAERA